MHCYAMGAIIPFVAIVAKCLSPLATRPPTLKVLFAGDSTRRYVICSRPVLRHIVTNRRLRQRLAGGYHKLVGGLEASLRFPAIPLASEVYGRGADESLLCFICVL